jgi:putative membrane protein
MSIRNYNPGRNRRGRVSIAAERFLYGSLALSALTQVLFLFQENSQLILVSAIFAGIFSLTHAQLAYAKRYFWGYLSFTLTFALAIESISLQTAWPFGKVTYQNLGIEVAGVPLLVLVIWLATLHPLVILARRIAPNWVFIVGAIALTSYQLFFDQLLVANSYKIWEFEGSHIPFQTRIPLSNLVGWLFVGVIYFGMANMILPKERRKISASLTSIDIFLVWIWVFNVSANIFFFEKPGTALLGGIFFGALIAPYLASRYLGQP